MKKFNLYFIVLLIAAILSSCMPIDEDVVKSDPNASPPQTKEELYSYYNKVERGMQRKQVEKVFGIGEILIGEKGESQTVKYLNSKKSAGVLVEYTADDTVRAKTLYFNTKNSLIPFSPQYDSSKIPEIKEKYPLSEAVKIFKSNPLEIVCEYSTTDPVGVSKIFAWYNRDGSSFQLQTKNGIITKRVLYGAK